MKINIIVKFNLFFQFIAFTSTGYCSPKPEFLQPKPSLTCNSLIDFRYINTGKMFHNWQNRMDNLTKNISVNKSCLFFACPCSFEFDGVYRSLRQNTNISEIPSDIYGIKTFENNDFQIILYLCGKGSINTISSTYKLIHKPLLRCDAIFMFGSCGTVSDSIQAGEICLPACFSNASSGRQIGASINGKPSRESGFGINYHGQYRDNSEPQLKPSEELLSFVSEALSEVKDQYILKFAEFREDYIGIQKVQLSFTIPRCLASSSSFMHSQEMAKFIYDAYEADLVDMETYALAHACTQENIPFIAIRIPSDDAGRKGRNMIDNGGRFIAANNLGIVANIITNKIVLSYKQ